MKKRIAILTLLMTSTLLGSAVALTDAETETAARPYVPADSVYLYTEKDDGMYEVVFRAEATGEMFEVKVDPATGAALKVESDKKGAEGAKEATLTGEQTAAAVEAAYPGARIVWQDAEKDDGLHAIKVFIVTDGLYGTLDLNAATGDILERDLSVGEYAEDGVTTEAAARAQVAAYRPGAEIVRIEMDKDDGQVYWEGEARLDGQRYEFTISAATGELIEWERD